MLIFPLNTETFKQAFLAGDGQLELQSDQDLWMSLVATGGKFLPTVDRIADVSVKLKTAQAFRFGDGSSLSLNIGGGATHQVQLLWPDVPDKLLKLYGLAEQLTDDKLYVRLALSATGAAAAEARFPAGQLSAGFSLAAGGNVAYERFKLYEAEDSAKRILGDLFATARLPQQVTTVAQIPAPGELLVTQFGGYLKLNGALNWGYALKGSKSFELNELKLELDYRLRAMAAVAIGYQLAGNFSLEVRAGEQAGWARFTIRKHRETQLNLAADFGFDGDFNLKGLPRSADEFLVRLLGADAKTVLRYFDATQHYASLDALEKTLTPMLKGFAHEWAQSLIGEVLTDATLERFLTAARKVATDHDELEDWLLDLYHAHLDRIPQLRRTLALLAGATDPSALVDGAEDESATSLSTWDVAQMIWGTNVYPLLLQKEEFAKLALRAQRARQFVEEDAFQPVRDVLEKLQAHVPLGALFGQLQKVKTAAELKQLGDARLQELVGRLTGRAFAKLKGSDLDDTLKVLQANLQRIEQFKERWYERMKAAVAQKFTFDLHAAYTRASSSDALLDVELNLNDEEGRGLAKRAAVGDFAQLLNRYDARVARIHHGALSHSLTKSAQLQINVLGWSTDSLRQLAENVEHTIEETSGGLLHVYAAETSLKQRRKSGRKFKETVESNFLLRALGETLQRDEQKATDTATRDYLIETLRELSVSYDLLTEDERTRPEELTRYLDFARFLGFFTAATQQQFVAELKDQFPAGLGKVKINYAVRYDTAALARAFAAISGDDLKHLARTTMREVVAAKYTGMKQTDQQVPIGFAYLAPETHQIFDRDGPNAMIATATLPAWFVGGNAARTVALRPEQRTILGTLCMIEAKYAQRLVELDRTLDEALQNKRPVPLKELQKTARKFVEMADDLDDFGGPNAFFATFDKIVQTAAPGAPRASAMQLEITPPAGKKVTKVLLQP